jgi:cobaltochelatase CobT
MKLWREFIEGQAGETLDRPGGDLADQAAFAKFARQIIEDLGYGDQLGDDPDAEDEQEDDGRGRPDRGRGRARQHHRLDDESTEENRRLARAEPGREQDAAQAQVSMDDMADAEMGEEAELPEGEAPMEPPPPRRSARPIRITRSI